MVGSKLNVYLAEDHNAVRKAMQSLLSSFEQVNVENDAPNSQELLRWIDENNPDAVILDSEMPVNGLVDAVKIIAKQFPSIKMLVLTMYSEAFFISTQTETGVGGFFNKPAEHEGAEKTLQPIIEEDFYKKQIIVKDLTNHHVDVVPCKLTNREMEILLLICQDLKPSEISHRLRISEKTFFNHRGNILSKTNSRSNVGLIRFAITHGYFEV